MKISMWMILDKLEQYHPRYTISDGSMRLTGIRFSAVQDDTQGQFVCVDWEKRPDGGVWIRLFNGGDEIICSGGGLDGLLNDLMRIFDFYNAWEAALWEAASRKSFQEVIDIGNTVLNNPIMISDMRGNVLAMSSAFVNEDLSVYWNESRERHLVPDAISGAPLLTESGEVATWTDTPEIYIMPDGSRTIGAYLTVDGERVAGIGIWGRNRPITESDVHLTRILYDALVSALDAQKLSLPLHSSAAFLTDLLSGAQYDDESMEALSARYPPPWRLIRIDHPLRRDEIHQHNLLQRFWSAKYPCVPFFYEDAIVVLASSGEALALVDAVFPAQQRLYSQICISLPFHDLKKIRMLYEQNRFIRQRAAQTPGLYRGEDYALAQLLSLFGENEQALALRHPALSKLKQYDAAKHSDLYETLYQYLLHGRSIQAAAEAMHVHRNTFIYRLERAREITDFDAEDPVSRIYLLLSYMIEKQGNIHDSITKN